MPEADKINSIIDRPAIEPEKEYIIGSLKEILALITQINSTENNLSLAKNYKDAATAGAVYQAQLAKIDTEGTKILVNQQKLLAEEQKVEQQRLKTLKLEADSLTATNKQLEAEEKLQQAKLKTQAIQAKAKPAAPANADIPFTTNLASIQAEQEAIAGLTGSVANLSAARQAEIDIALETYTAQQSLAETTVQTSEAVAAVALTYDEYTGTLAGNLAAIIDNNTAIAENSAEQKELAEAIAATGFASEAQVTRLIELRQEGLLLAASNKELSATVKNQITDYGAEEGSLVSLTAQLNLLRQSYGALSAEELASPLGGKLQTEITKVNSSVEALNNNVGKFGGQVGNYTGAIEKTFGRVTNLGNITSRVITQLSRQMIGLLTGFLSFYIGAKAIEALVAAVEDHLAKVAPIIDKTVQSQQILNETLGQTSGAYVKATTTVDALTINVGLAKQGFLNKSEVLKEYNDTLGKTLGHTDDLNTAEQLLVSKGPAYIQMMLYKAAAQLALDDAAKKALKSAQDTQDSVNKIAALDDTKTVGARTGLKKNADGTFSATKNTAKDQLAGGLIGDATTTKLKADTEIKQLTDIATNFQKKAALLAKDFNIDFFEGKDDNKTTTTKEIKDNTAEVIAKAKFETNKRVIVDAQKADKAIADDERATFQQRLEALEKFNADTKALQALQTEFDKTTEENKLAQTIKGLERQKAELEKQKTTGKGNNSAIDTNIAALNAQEVRERTATNAVLKNIDDKFRDDKVNDDLEYAKSRDTLIETEFTKEDAGRQEDIANYQKYIAAKKQLVLDAIDSNTNKEKIKLESEYEIKILKATGDQKAKLEQELADKLKVIDDKNTLERLEAEGRYLQGQLGAAKLIEADTTDIEAKITANLEKQTAARVAIAKAGGKEITQAEKDRLDKFLGYEKAASDLLKTIVDGRYTTEKNAIQDKIDANDAATQKEIDNINATQTTATNTEQVKAAEIAQIQAQAQAKKTQLELEQRKLDYSRAKFEKELAISDIIIDTIVQVIKAGGLFTPKGAEIAFYGAIGLAKALSTPLPKFADGKNDGYEGYGIVDDGGRTEPIYRADTGTIEMSSGSPKDRITYLKKRDIVWPSVEAMMSSINFGNPFELSAPSGAASNDMHIIADAISGITVHGQILTQKGWVAQNMKLDRYNNYVKRQIRN